MTLAEDRMRQLRAIPLFSALSDQDMRRVASLAGERSYRLGSTIYRQGQLDTNLYLVISGRLRVYIRDERGGERTLNYLEAGDAFGEHALLTGERRDVTAVAEQDTTLVYLRKRDFDELLSNHPRISETLGVHKLARLRKVPLFQKLSIEDTERIAAMVGQAHYRPESVICRQGQSGIGFYVIESGRVAVRARGETGQERSITELREGDFFGQHSLLTGQPTDTTKLALADTSVFYLKERDFDRLLVEYPSIRDALNLKAKVRQTMLSHRFPWQREDELLVALSRKHIYAFIRSLWVLIFPLLALAAILALALTINWNNALLYLICTLIGASAFALVAWLFLDWRNDYYAVTNKRVVHVEKTILVRETRDEAPLERIQDVTILMPGIVAKLLGFDDLSIQTAGASGRVVFKTLGNAAWVRDTIFDQLDRIRAEETAEERESIRRKLELELGRAEPEPSPVPDLQETPTSGEREASSVAEPGATLLPELMRRFRSYLIPQTRLEEDGVVTWRKHWFRLVDKIAAPFLLLFILSQLGAAAVLGLLPPVTGFERWFSAALLIGLPACLILIWYRYEDWRNDIYRLTDDRIIDIDKLPLGLREERREASLAMIQDIKYEIPGVMANLLDYGHVIIETAGRQAVFSFSWVHRPRRVQEEIFARMDMFREKEKERERARRTSQLIDWFATYTDLDSEHPRLRPDDGQ